MIENVLILSLSLAALAGCTTAQRQSAETGLSVASAAAPAVCSFIQGLDKQVACSADAGAASAVAQLVENVLQALPPAASRRAPSAAPEPSKQFTYTYNGVPVTVTLPASKADFAWKSLSSGGHAQLMSGPPIEGWAAL